MIRAILLLSAVLFLGVEIGAQEFKLPYNFHHPGDNGFNFSFDRPGLRFLSKSDDTQVRIGVGRPTYTLGEPVAYCNITQPFGSGHCSVGLENDQLSFNVFQKLSFPFELNFRVNQRVLSARHPNPEMFLGLYIPIIPQPLPSVHALVEQQDRFINDI